MNCKKCACTVFKPFVDGFRSCTNCGSLTDAQPFTPTMPFMPQKNIPAPRAAKPLPILPHTDIVEKYRDSIAQRRNTPIPTSWRSLAILISAAEQIKISEKQLQRCYERMAENGA